MGMFFYVKKEEGDKCPYCKEELVDDFQSKSSINGEHDVWGGCCDRHPDGLPLLEKSEVENYYDSCSECGKWIEYVDGVLIEDKLM